MLRANPLKGVPVRSPVTRLTLALLALLLATPASAHDFWIEAKGNAVGTPIPLRLKIGPAFNGAEEYPFNPLHIVRFVRVGPDGGQVRLVGFTGQKPAGRFTPRKPGRYVLAYQSAASQITLEPAKFTEYLNEEGLKNVLTWRATKGEARKDGREKFRRNAKAIVQAGPTLKAPVDRVIGMPFELVAQTDPIAGGAVVFQALVDGKPAADVRVAAYSAPDAKPVEGRTDAEGKVTLTLDKAGHWLVKSVHAKRVGDGNVDWLSDWASLTFEVRGK